MKNYILKRNQRSLVKLKRDKSLQSEDGLRASSLAGRQSQSSERRNLLSTKHRQYSKSVARNTLTPYQNFVRQMKIKLPTPKQKFYQFLKIQPFNRIQSHNELIALFLKNVKFFKLHQNSLIINLSRKVRLVQYDELDEKMMIIILQGECFYQGKYFTSGQLINRQVLKPTQVNLDPLAKIIAINRHEYFSFLSAYVHQQMIRFKEFINSIQTFKMFSEKTLQKFSENMSLHYYLKGQKLYKVGDDANCLYVVFSGKVSRRVVIEIEKINKIPYKRFEKQVRILNKSYSHQIQFFKEEMVGVTQIIDGVAQRKEEIDVDEDTILLSIDRSIVEESMDDYIIDRLKKYNLKKYPENYDQLCNIYLKQKIQMRKVEERKITALQNELNIGYNDKRREKIQSIIRMYEGNIKQVDNKNLLSKKLHFQRDLNK